MLTAAITECHAVTDPTAAGRKRRERARKKRGLLPVSVDLLERERRGLVKKGLLALDQIDEPAAVGRAVEQFLERFFEMA